MYHWENSTSKSRSKSKSNSKYNDPNYPTFSPSSSSSFLNKFNKSLKTHPSKTHQNEPINRPKATEDEKMASLRRACLVEKWMERKVSDKVISRERKSNSRSSSTLLEEFDLQDTFFSRSTTNTSSSSDEIDYSVFSHSKQKTLTTCFAPPKPKPIKTHTIESKFLNQFSQQKDKNDEDFIKNRSRAAKVYSNLKNLKQPISPGVRLTSFINSLFTKEGKSSSKYGGKKKTEDLTTMSTSTCSSASSFSRSCLIKDKKFQDDGVKRTVRFCPVSVIVDDDSQPCGYKSLQEESESLLLNTKFKRSLSKRYQELKKLNGLERESDQKKLEEVALDLLSGYWDNKLNKSHDLSKIKGTNDDNHGDTYDDNDDDGFSCSSSDLFELDHLSLIGNELPVYETTQFDN